MLQRRLSATAVASKSMFHPQFRCHFNRWELIQNEREKQCKKQNTRFIFIFISTANIQY
jgi:hypothetical protein